LIDKLIDNTCSKTNEYIASSHNWFQVDLDETISIKVLKKKECLKLNSNKRPLTMCLWSSERHWCFGQPFLCDARSFSKWNVYSNR